MGLSSSVNPLTIITIVLAHFSHGIHHFSHFYDKITFIGLTVEKKSMREQYDLNVNVAAIV
jgi:hypothetical protein